LYFLICTVNSNIKSERNPISIRFLLLKNNFKAINNNTEKRNIKYPFFLNLYNLIIPNKELNPSIKFKDTKKTIMA
jgi:hypothetical protein